jgi:hypothetical protein
MTTEAVQLFSVSTALVAAGGIATLSLFDVPMLQSQPASRSLPMTRWLFSRGSHIFPEAAALSSAGFAYLAYETLPSSERALSAILRHTGSGSKAGLYIAAAVLTISIAPFTQLMIPTNFSLIQKNEDKGGARSQESAKIPKPAGRTAEDSVAGKNASNELRDLSNPQEKTREDSTATEDEEVRELLGKFGKLNAVRAVLVGVGGVVGLAAALA